MDGPGDYHTKWIKSDKERQAWYDCLYVALIQKMMQMNLLPKRNKLTDPANKFMATKGKVGSGINWEFGNNTYTFLYLGNQ